MEKETGGSGGIRLTHSSRTVGQVKPRVAVAGVGEWRGKIAGQCEPRAGRAIPQPACVCNWTLDTAVWEGRSVSVCRCVA